MKALSHIAIFCNDLDRMESFYQLVFEMKTLWKEKDKKVYLTTGNHDNFGLLKREGHQNTFFDLNAITADPNNTPNFPHFGLIVDSDVEFEDILSKLRSMNIQFVGPKVSRDKTKSVYFHDPENNPVQVMME